MALPPRTLFLTAGAAAVLVAGGTTAAFAAGSAPTVASTTASASTCAPGLRPLLRAASRSLSADLQHLAKDTTAGKAGDRAEIRKKALAGDYGVRIERVARIVAGETGALPSTLPAALKADLKTLRADPRGSDARKAEAATIWSKALAGGYGPTIESLAKDAKARVDQRCAAGTPSTGTGS
jgi:hypothetical protein